MTDGGAGYYSRNLSAERLQLCYEVASPAVRRYLEAEIEHLEARLPTGARVLELGCGYGRVLERLVQGGARPALLVGIDLSLSSLLWGCACGPGRRTGSLSERSRGGRAAAEKDHLLATMDAVRLGLADNSFDVVACLQNGISAFRVDHLSLLVEAMRVTRPGGKVLLSTYAEAFWEHRLEWFRVQAAHGLVGEIDEDATFPGTIVCRDGFRATTPGPADLLEIASRARACATVTEVAGSSVFLEVDVPLASMGAGSVES
jgi:2-polyprenyl-6-hydroxyphenyl methylase/3-demethylubiquinone-9 3-methyltransferase